MTFHATTTKRSIKTDMKLKTEKFNKIGKECLKIEQVYKMLPHPDKEYHWEIYYKLMSKIHNEVCSSCVMQDNCKLISYTHRSDKNVIINDFKHEKELVFFHDPLLCIDEAVNTEIGGKNWVNIDGILFPKDENTRNGQFLESMANSSRQSRDAFWGYAMSNEWNYFVTLTTDKLKVDRYDDKAVYRLWTLCRQRIQRADKNAKILLVPERHEDGALHFHGFVTCKSFTLVPFCIKGDKQEYSSCGSPLWIFPYWNYGFASCAVLPHNDFVFDSEKKTIEEYSNEKCNSVLESVLKFDEKRQAPYAQDENGNVLPFSQRRVVAYLDKYVGKQFGSVGYCKKSFFRTHNVEAKTKTVSYMGTEELAEVLRDGNYELYKSENGKDYYRTKSSERSLLDPNDGK